MKCRTAVYYINVIMTHLNAYSFGHLLHAFSREDHESSESPAAVTYEKPVVRDLLSIISSSLTVATAGLATKKMAIGSI